MRKLILIFGFILMSTSLLNAQVCEKISCDNLRDYVTIKIIEESVKSDQNKFKLEEYFKQNTIENPYKYSDFISKLDNNDFKQTREKLGDVINSININANAKKVEFATDLLGLVALKLNDKQKTNCNFDALKPKLIAEINSYLNKYIPDTSVEYDNASNEATVGYDDEQTIPVEDSSNEKPSFFSLSNFNFFTLLGIMLPLILFFILLIKINDLQNKNKRRKDDIANINQSTFSTQNTPNRTQLSLTEFENLLSNSRYYNDLHKAVENLQKQTPNNNPVTSVPANQTYQQSTVPQSNSSDIFYMKYPVENTFSNNHKSLTKENTIYKFFLKANKNEAEFEIHTDGVKIEEIISMAEKTIKTGCEEENFPSSNSRNIRTLNKGLVSLEGDKWVIKRKAVIRYE